MILTAGLTLVWSNFSGRFRLNGASPGDLSSGRLLVSNFPVNDAQNAILQFDFCVFLMIFRTQEC